MQKPNTTIVFLFIQNIAKLLKRLPPRKLSLKLWPNQDGNGQFKQDLSLVRDHSIPLSLVLSALEDKIRIPAYPRAAM